MQGRLARCSVVGTAEGFAIDCYGLAFEGSGNFVSPALECCVELNGIEARESPAEGIVRRDAIFKWKVLSEPVQLSLTVAFYIHPSLGVGNTSTQGQKDHLGQRIVHATIYSWIGNIFKVIVSFTNQRRCHGPTPSQKSSETPFPQNWGLIELQAMQHLDQSQPTCDCPAGDRDLRSTTSHFAKSILKEPDSITEEPFAVRY